MSSLVSRATGNFTTAATWGLVDSTSELDSNAATVAIGTSNIDSATFTPGAITVEGIALKFQNRAASPSGTFTVTLRNSTGSSDVASVTVNVSDLPYSASAPSLGYGWIFFKFSASQTLLAATNYLVRVICSASGSQVTLWRNGTGNNVCRKLVTTTTQAPASGDHLAICKEWTAAATGTDIAVTFNNTATTSFGPTVSGGPPEGIVISQGGSLVSATSASTDYYLKWKGIMHVVGGGLLKIGEAGTPIPSTSTFTLHCNCVANVDTGVAIDSGGTLTVQGATKNHATTLTANAASSATVLTLGSTSGWAASDVLGLGPGNVASTEFQKATILTVDSGTQVTLTAGISAAKRGATPHFTEVINLTRNVKFIGESSSLRGFLSWREQCAGTVRYASFANWGADFTTQGKMSIDIQPHGTGAFTMEYCSLFEQPGNQPHTMIHTSKTGSVTFRYNVGYSPGNRFLYSNGSSLAAVTWTDNVVIGMTGGGAPVYDFNLMGPGWNFSRTVVSGMPSNCTAFQLAVANNVQIFDVTGLFDDMRLSYPSAVGLRLGGSGSNMFVGKISGLQAYMSGSMGVYMFNDTDVHMLEFVNPVIWGNVNYGFYPASNAERPAFFTLKVTGGTFAGSSLQGQTRGIALQQRYGSVILDSCSFGATSGILGTHSSADFDSMSDRGYVDLLTHNTTFNSTNKVVGFSGATKTYRLRHQKYGGTTNDNRADFKVNKDDSWTLRRDATIYNNAAPSEKVMPTIGTATGKAASASWFVSVEASTPKTLGVYVRKSASGDGAAYTGAQPRLIVKANVAAGITSDQVIDTMTASTGSWELLTGSSPSPSENCVLEVYVDCDGAAGWINVDDRTAT